MPSLKHESLLSTLIGIELSSVVQFRGIPYGQIPERFAQPQTITTYPDRLDCTRYGLLSSTL
ncbi:hypothetical protein B0J13DRAFT_565606 [Dactylonectria estremocensis]|uniref:Carboxylesterase type B domain-containing protein n=1 Tax=Dactylonectria estremocensis TaxID=1079267 RepID=A0A9P9DTV6_9HYPO|nr:hypothetical protein B0J13DRAFT_565606 [Dactylonectria estremocensis]